MDILSARMRGLLTLAALALIAPACWARPLLVAPKHLEFPLPPGAQEPLGQYDPSFLVPAIDGDTVLVAARRAINANNDRIDGVYIFQRAANGNWIYAGPLLEGQTGTPLLNGNLATVRISQGLRVYERGAQGWSLNATIPLDQLDLVFRLDEGAIYVRRNSSVWPPPSCLPPFRQYRKVNGSWSVVATIGGERCDDHVADVNDGRALVVREPIGDRTTRLPAQVFADTGAASWPLVASFTTPLPNTGYVNIYGRGGSIRGNLAHIDRGYFYRDAGNNNWVAAGKMVEPEVELSTFSNGGVLRGAHLFLYGFERDYELPSSDPDFLTEWHTLRAYREQPNGTFQYYAKLSADFNVWWWAVSEDGKRVTATSPSSNWRFDEPANRLYVFEIPDDATFPGTQQDTFESGNFARWTPTAGAFAVASTSSSRVLRQSSLAGDSGANLTAIDWNDQSIEADIRPLEFAGNGRWFGLVTRRVDSNNYYYVTFRSPNLISLRRLSNGVVTEIGLGWAPANFTPGRSYRVRLESVGDQHAVFLEGIPFVHAKDTTFAHGHPGVAGYRTRFDVDNVIVSGGTRLLLRLDTRDTGWVSQGPEGSTSWQYIVVDGRRVLRQSDNTGDVRWISKVAVGNQVVSARVRPVSYGATTGTDPWVGIAAHLVDEQNYYYLTLRRSNQLSLRRVVNGQIQVLATVTQPVATGTWYDLRLEMIGTNIRAYVNGDLRIQTRDPTRSGGGRNALLMYKTAADFESYIAYQP